MPLLSCFFRGRAPSLVLVFFFRVSLIYWGIASLTLWVFTLLFYNVRGTSELRLVVSNSRKTLRQCSSCSGDSESLRLNSLRQSWSKLKEIDLSWEVLVFSSFTTVTDLLLAFSGYFYNINYHLIHYDRNPSTIILILKEISKLHLKRMQSWISTWVFRRRCFYSHLLTSRLSLSSQDLALLSHRSSKR